MQAIQLRKLIRLLAGLLLLFAPTPSEKSAPPVGHAIRAPRQPEIAADADKPLWQVVQGAKRQIGVTLRYDPAYSRLAYPGGDVPLDRGVCTDVIIRAYRHAGIDLQVLVHDDISQHWSAYPHVWGLSRPDPNIDHRRVPNLETFFRRHGSVLPVSTRAADYLPGDIVTWRLANGLPHIGLVTGTGIFAGPLVTHNIGRGAREEAVLFAYRLAGHFRYTGPLPAGAGSR